MCLQPSTIHTHYIHIFVLYIHYRPKISTAVAGTAILHTYLKPTFTYFRGKGCYIHHPYLSITQRWISSSAQDAQMTERCIGHPAVAHAQTSRNDKTKRNKRKPKQNQNQTPPWLVYMHNRSSLLLIYDGPSHRLMLTRVYVCILLCLQHSNTRGVGYWFLLAPISSLFPKGDRTRPSPVVD